MLGFAKAFLSAAAALLPPQKSSSLFLLSIITFIMTLTILLSARHAHEIGIWALQIDESIVMKLMMSRKRKAGLYRERIGGAAHSIGFTTSLWHSNGSGKASTRMGVWLTQQSSGSMAKCMLRLLHHMQSLSLWVNEEKMHATP
jgi:hypothetical protein